MTLAGCGPQKVVPQRDVDVCRGARWQTMPGDGMAPTVLARESLAWVSYDGARTPRVGDVVIFRVGDGADDVHVSRVVGVGPSEVTFVDHLLVSSGQDRIEHAAPVAACLASPSDSTCRVFEESVVGDSHRAWRVQRHVVSDADNHQPFGTWSVPAAHVFVAGDNRVVSQDSRVGPRGHGRPLPRSALLGRVVAVQRDGRCAPLLGT